jgi:tetratricopeptide (TPR) repeat protein
MMRAHYGAATTHPEIAVTLGNLGFCYLAESEYAEAERHLTDSLAMWEALHSGPHDHTAWVLGSLGRMHLRKGELPEAERRLEQALEMLGKVHSGPNAVTAEVLGTFGELHIKKKEMGKAKIRLDEALEMYRKVLPDGHEDIEKCLSLLEETQQKLDAEDGGHDEL